MEVTGVLQSFSYNVLKLRAAMSDLKPTTQQDRLTRAQFDGLLRRLGGCSGRPGEKYEEFHWKLVKFFQWSSCLTAEDLADATLNRVAHKLETGGEAIQDVEAFAWGVAKKIKQEARKKDVKTIRLEDMPSKELFSDAGASVDALHKKIQSQKELNCLHQCLQRFPAEDRTLFLAYRVDKGHYMETRNGLAQRYGLTPGALRVRVIRMREKLERCLDVCLRAK
jgi:RNA polymerase sigma factor (sigma-70 family)